MSQKTTLEIERRKRYLETLIKEAIINVLAEQDAVAPPPPAPAPELPPPAEEPMPEEEVPQEELQAGRLHR